MKGTPIPRSEALLDAAVEYTFPASDPISIDHAFRSAAEREDRAAEGNADEGEKTRPALSGKPARRR